MGHRVVKRSPERPKPHIPNGLNPRNSSARCRFVFSFWLCPLSSLVSSAVRQQLGWAKDTKERPSSPFLTHAMHPTLQALGCAAGVVLVDGLFRTYTAELQRL